MLGCDFTSWIIFGVIPVAPWTLNQGPIFFNFTFCNFHFQAGKHVEA